MATLARNGFEIMARAGTGADAFSDIFKRATGGFRLAGLAQAVHSLPQGRLAALNLDCRGHAARAVFATVPLFLYPFVGTISDITSAAFLMVLLTGLFLINANIGRQGRHVANLLTSLLASAAFLLNPAVGLSFLLLAAIERLAHDRREAHPLIGPATRVLATALIVDMGAMLLEIERSSGLITTVMLIACFFEAALHAATPPAKTDRSSWPMVTVGGLACFATASYLFLVSTDPVFVHIIGDSALLTAPLLIFALLRIIHLSCTTAERSLKFIGQPDADTSKAKALFYLKDDFVLMTIFGWCLAMSIFELIGGTL